MNRYDYIIAGAGASGLSLLMHMIKSGQFSGKKILLIDKAPKTENDRTWCFWDTKKGLFDNIVHRRWNKMRFFGPIGNSQLHDISPYEYKMIRAIEFYNYCFDEIARNKNVTVRYGQVDHIDSYDDGAAVTLNGSIFTAKYVFSSIPTTVPAYGNAYVVWQHFKGWILQTDNKRFSCDEATLMDFRVDQQSDCRFVYVLPLSDTRALVEYTVFSEARLGDGEYNAALTSYCSDHLGLSSDNYKIEEEEFGMIRMTNYNFPKSDGNIIYLGTSGGQTKPSTGYTFRFIQQHSSAIVSALMEDKFPVAGKQAKKFDFYDSVLLRIISGKELRGADIFTSLFSKNKMRDVMKFLDNETSLYEDLKIMRSLPATPFMLAAISHLVK